jgi:hypothetical protein
LGFKQFIEWSVTNLQLRKAIFNDLHFDHSGEYSRLFDHPITDHTGRIVKLADVQWTAFSDSIVISTDTNGGQQAFLTYLCQMSCVRYAGNCFLRGGLSFGPLYHESNVIFGPAMNQAYELEQRAEYPRIVVDPRMVESLSYILMVTSPNPDSRIFPSIASLRKDESDGTTYVNTVGFALAKAFNEVEREKFYVATGATSPDENPRMWREWPGKVKHCVEYQLSAHEKGSKVFNKYLWFANYFNDAYFNNRVYAKDGTLINSPDTAMGEGIGYQFGVPIEIPG